MYLRKKCEYLGNNCHQGEFFKIGSPSGRTPVLITITIRGLHGSTSITIGNSIRICTGTAVTRFVSRRRRVVVQTWDFLNPHCTGGSMGSRYSWYIVYEDDGSGTLSHTNKFVMVIHWVN